MLLGTVPWGPDVAVGRALHLALLGHRTYNFYLVGRAGGWEVCRGRAFGWVWEVANYEVHGKLQPRSKIAVEEHGPVPLGQTGGKELVCVLKPQLHFRDVSIRRQRSIALQQIG